MKGSLNLLGVFLTVIMLVCDAVEFLAVPALIVICGLICGYPAEFYIVAIGAYILFFAIIELLAYIFSKLFGKKINSFMTRKLEKYFEKNEKEINEFIEKSEPTFEKLSDIFTKDNTKSEK